MVHQVEHGPAHDVPRQRLDVGEPPVDCARYVVDRAPRDRIVELAAGERAPRQLEQGTPVATSRAARERRQWLGEPLEGQLSRRGAPLERRPGGVHALQRPGVAVGPAQLPVERRRFRAFPSELEELIEPRHSKRAARLELSQQLAQAGHGGVSGMMVGADEHGDVLPGGALHERRPDTRPHRAQAVGIRGQRSPELVAPGREVP